MDASSNPRGQRLVLRLIAITSLIALPAIIVPRLAAEKLSWLVGFGQPPLTPLLLYMMAGGAAVFVGQAVLLWAMSADVTRYQPLIRLVAWIYLACGPLFIWIDSQAGMPLWWQLMDVCGCILAGAVLLWSCYHPSKL